MRYKVAPVVDASELLEAVQKETNLFDDLGADEFDLVEISMIVEEEFDLVPDEDELKKVVTVADLCKFVENC